MISLKTRCGVADNSGAKRVVCIKVFGGSRARYASVGDRVKIAVKESDPHSKIAPGSVHTAVVVRTKRRIKREDGSYICFDENSVVLIDDNNEPIGTRIFGPVARELRGTGFLKIVSLAPEVL